MTQPRKSIYRSRVDWWIALMLVAGPLICVVLTAVMLYRGQDRDALICLLTGAGTLLLTVLLTIPCRYTILSDTLSIRSGLIVQRVPIDQIRNVEPSGSWQSGPALSLRRVKISTASRFYLVSPEERERFIEELTEAVKDSK
ncbi:MAG: PH domain-containing protein [Planctomycetota bacterium]